ncbi:hypothetical protein [Nostoc sp. LPT]|uniref:hypothetical protein n=1 Tax=Nostoc sp. LPT TaxID=2815387 RepID=UPI001D4A9AF6|nr:hypothetical protein [Nostoc sp. LPT]MBN4002323.1 hypothetical protein [Nostoc sp. LPT]
MTAVELENLSKTFTLSRGWGRNRTKKEIVAVDGISLSVPDGQAIAFIGPNGEAGSVADIAIEDPPLEEVIAHIYAQAA